jgi:hypothetical protein
VKDINEFFVLDKTRIEVVLCLFRHRGGYGGEYAGQGRDGGMIKVFGEFEGECGESSTFIF